MTSAHILSLDLRAEAAAELLRLTASRTMAGSGDEAALAFLEGDAPWATVVRGARRRRALRRRVLLVWRVAYEDASGGVVDSCLAPVVVELCVTPARFARRAGFAAIVRDADAEMRARIESATVGWRQSVELVSRAFAAARLSRERAIAAHLANVGEQVFQPGLFDHRADRTRELRAVAALDAGRAVSERLATVERRAAAAPASPRLLLALLP